jgi:putative membrane protein
MRWIHLTIIILLAAATLLFVLQNRDVVTMSFLGFSVRAPLAILIAVVYVIGAVTGGSLFALLRRSYKARNAIARSKSRGAAVSCRPDCAILSVGGADGRPASISK